MQSREYAPIHTTGIKAVAFDLDGTLAKTVRPLIKAHQILLIENDKDPKPEDEIRQLIGHPPQTVFESLHGTYSKKLHERFATIVGSHQHLVERVLWAKATVEAVRKEGMVPTLLTGRSLFIEETLAVSGLHMRDFDIIRDGTISPGKPNSVCMDEIAVYTKCNYEEIAVVGDGGVDMATANDVGALAIGVSLEDIRPVEGASITIYSLYPVTRILQENNAYYKLAA